MRQLPFLVLFITIFIDLLGFGLVIPILPLFAEDLGASAFEIGMVGAIYSAMQFLFAPFWGNLSDRFGRKPIILVSVLINGMAFLLFGNAAILAILFISRLLSGIGAANLSAAQAYISDISTPENRTKSFGIIGAAFGLGFIFGPPIGGIIQHDYGIEWVGFTAAGLCAVNFLVALFFLPESLQTKNKSNKLTINPLADLFKIVDNPAIRDIVIINLVFITAFSMMQISSSLMWQSKYELDSKQIGFMFMYIGFLSAIIQGGLLGYFNKKLGEKKMLIYGIIFLCVGLFTLPLAPKSLFFPLEYISMLLLALGNSFLNPTLVSLISKLSDPKAQGKMMGVNQSFSSLGRVIGPLIGGAFYGYHYAMPFIAGAVLMVLVLWLALMLIRNYLMPMATAV